MQGNNDLATLNRARLRRGRAPYRYDETLTQVAKSRANTQARRGGRSRHVAGNYNPGRAEGVSASDDGNPIANACFAMSRRFRTAGAACTTGRNGRTYCSLVLR